MKTCMIGQLYNQPGTDLQKSALDPNWIKLSSLYPSCLLPLVKIPDSGSLPIVVTWQRLECKYKRARRSPIIHRKSIRMPINVLFRMPISRLKNQPIRMSSELLFWTQNWPMNAELAHECRASQWMQNCWWRMQGWLCWVRYCLHL